MAAILISVSDITKLKTWLAIIEESIYAEHVKYRYLADPEISRTIQAIYPQQASPKPELQDLLAKLRLGL
jgi:hypothetical protein